MKNKVSFIFDIDGTLTPSRQMMLKHHEERFTKFLEGKQYFFVTGSDYSKVKEQLPETIRKNATTIFTCLGSERWHNDVLVSEDEPYVFRKELFDILNFWLENWKELYPQRYGNHIEERKNLINFSIPGRNIPVEQRQTYVEWDKIQNERGQAIKLLQESFPELDFSAGGQISIDITPKGNTKAKILTYLRNTLTIEDNFIFLGDRIAPYGNDLPLADALKIDMVLNPNIKNVFFNVLGPDNTLEILDIFSNY